MSAPSDPPRLRALSGSNVTPLARAVREAQCDGPSERELAAIALALGITPPSGPDGGGEPNPSGGVGRGPSAVSKAFLSARPFLIAASVTLGLIGGSALLPSSSPKPSRALASSMARETSAPEAAQGVPAPVVQELGADTATSAKTEPEPPAHVSRKPKTVSAPDPNAELSLLERAKASLGAMPSRTLALTSQHKQTFPRGMFVEEREMLAIEALYALHRAPEATRRAKVLLAKHPRTAYVTRLQTLLREHGEHAP